MCLNDNFYQYIANNTNINAATKGFEPEDLSDCLRTWHAATREKVKSSFGIMIYMNLHGAPNTESHWNRDIQVGAVHPVSAYMSLDRFQQLSRFPHISKADISPDLFRYRRPSKPCPFVKHSREVSTDENQRVFYDLDELIQFLHGATFQAWKLHFAQCKAKGKPHLCVNEFRKRLWRQLLSSSPFQPVHQS